MSKLKSATMESSIAVDMSESLKMTTPPSKRKQAKSEYDKKPVYEFVKAFFDFFASLIALIILSPVLLIIALVIYFDDKGNPIFVQERCGKNGELFKMYKFRTMCVDAEARLADLKDRNEMDGPVFKMKDDPRITRVGKFLRSSGLDELPQLLNILKGNMSVVGPRPALPNEVEKYSESDRFRLLIKPGLTCYWQIAPERNSISFEKWMELDRQYVNNRNVLIDIVLIFKTVAAVVKRQGC